MKPKRILKKAAALLLAITMVFGAAPLNGIAGLDLHLPEWLKSPFSVEANATGYNGNCGENLTWSLDAETGVLTISGTGDMDNWEYEVNYAPWQEYKDEITTVAIADGVTSIGSFAFLMCDNLSAVVFGENSKLKTICNSAFPECRKLKSFDIPSGVTSIGNSAFYMTGLTSINIPTGVTSIGDSVFYATPLTSIDIPDNVTSIGDYAFHSCNALKSITIPESIKSIGDGAFYYCEGLKSVNISSGVIHIGEDLFCGCKNLISITVSTDNANYSSDERGVLFNKDKTELIQYPTGNTVTSYTIPDSVTSIGVYAFDGCTSLASIAIPDSVTSIGNYAFANCDSLEEISVAANNANYSSADNVLFNKNKTVLIFYPTGKIDTSYEIPGSVICIGNSALVDCDRLVDITIPDSVTSIGNSAFKDCDSLADITIPDGVTSIGNFTFAYCTRLSSVTIPDSVTSITDYAFAFCTELADVYYGGNEIDRAAMAIDSSNENLINATWHYSSNGPEVISVTGITVSPTNTTLAVDATQQLTATVTPSNATNKTVSYTSSDTTVATVSSTGLVTAKEVGTATITATTADGSKTATCTVKVVTVTSFLTFTLISGCTEYEVSDCNEAATGELTIPSTYNGKPVTSIGEYSFYYCTELSSVTIPDSVTSFGENAFRFCTKLSSITIPDSVTSIGNGAFYHCTGLTDITVSSANANYSSQDGVLFDKTKTQLIQYPTGNTRTSYSIPDSVKSIGSYSFFYCSLSSITIPDGVTNIGREAFLGTELSSITIPDSVTSIGSHAFKNTVWYNNQPDGLIYIGKVAYEYIGTMPDGTVIEIRDGTKGIAGSAFENCRGLSAITISNSVTNIGDMAFENCTGLSSITIPNSVTSIGNSAFYYCTGLTDITVSTANANYSSQDGVLFDKTKTQLIQYPIGNTRTSYSIPDSVTSIGDYAFAHYSVFSAINITQNVESISDYAFWLCTNLTVTCYENSYAHQYCIDNNIPYTFANINEQYLPTFSTWYGGNTYALYDDLLTWAEAKQVCEMLGGHLAVITSAEEQAAVTSLVSNNPAETSYCIGMSDIDSEGIWTWVTGESFSSYTNWDSGEPNNGGTEIASQNAGQIYSSKSPNTTGKWDDAREKDLRGFICEFEPYHIPVATTMKDGHIYSVYNESFAWETTKMYCERLGGHLVTITDAVEQQLVESLISGQRDGLFWIGASDSETEGTFKWSNGEAFEYRNWGPNEPNGGDAGEDCAQIYSRPYNTKILGHWNDTRSNPDTDNSLKTSYYRLSNIGYICEVETNDFAPCARQYYGTSLYEVFDECLSWQDAQTYAESRGGHLVTISDEAEQQFVNGLFSSLTTSKDAYWLGGACGKYDRNFKWITGESFSYTNWAPGEPNNSSNVEVRIIVNADGVWNDTSNRGNSGTGGCVVIEYDNHKEPLTLAEKDGTEITSYNVQGGTLVEYPTTHDTEGYTTVWYKDSELLNEWNFSEDVITEATTLYVKRTANKYTVSFDANGGSVGNITQKTVTYDGKYGNYPTPTREGYTFAGWYSAAENGEQIIYSTVVKTASNHTIYAHWNPNEYTVTYDYAGGAAEEKNKTVLYGEAYGTLPIPTKSGYKFIGWTLDDGITEINETNVVSTVGSHALCAQWTERSAVSYEVISSPTKTDYVLGDEVDTDGLVLAVTYDNGETENITSGFTCSPTVFDEVGSQTVQYEYDGQIGSFSVTVTKGDPSSMTIKTLPNTLTYCVGESMDSDGMTLELSYLDGSTETISQGFSVSPAIFTRAGRQKVTVSYAGYSAVFAVTVSNVLLSSISVATMPDKVEYITGETLDTTGLTLIASYENGSTKTIISGFAATCDFSGAGEKTVSVSYTENNQTVMTSFTVTVTAATEQQNATVSAPIISAQAGQTVSVPVSISNNKGFMGFTIALDYDSSIFTPISVTPGTVLSNVMLNDNISSHGNNKLKIMLSANENIVGDGILFTVTFSVSATAEGNETIGLSYIQADTFNEDWEDVVFNCVNISVNINNAAAESVPKFYSTATAATAGEEFALPIMLENACNMTALSIELKYDSSLLTPVSLTDGSVLASDVSENTNADTGTLTLSWSGSAITSDGRLLSVIFDVREYAHEQSTIEISCSNAIFDGIDTLNAMCENIVLNVTNPHAAEPAELYSSQQIVTVGETVNIPVYIRNNHGIMGCGILVEYDKSLLTPVSVTRGAVIGSRGFFDNSIDTSKQSFKVIWNHSENINDNGLMFTLTFVVNSKTKAEAATVNLSCIDEDSYNEKWETVVLNTEPVAIQLDRLCVTSGASHVYVGNTLQLTAAYRLNSKAAGTIQWTSSNTSIATVDENGLLTAKHHGNVRIEATDVNGNTAEYFIQVLPLNAVVSIGNYSGNYTRKINWWKPYSSAKMSLYFTTHNCNDAVRYVWSSDNSRVKIDQSGNVTNTGSFSRSATITLTAYDAENNVVAKSSVKVSFYKFSWQQSRLQSQAIVSDNIAQQSLSENELELHEAEQQNSELSFITDFVYYLLDLLMVIKLH